MEDEFHIHSIGRARQTTRNEKTLRLRIDKPPTTTDKLPCHWGKCSVHARGVKKRKTSLSFFNRANIELRCSNTKAGLPDVCRGLSMGQRSVLRPPFFAKEFYWHSHQNAKSTACREFVYAPAQRFITFPQEAYWHTHENGQSKACRRFVYVYAPAQRFVIFPIFPNFPNFPNEFQWHSCYLRPVCTHWALLSVDMLPKIAHACSFMGLEKGLDLG